MNELVIYERVDGGLKVPEQRYDLKELKKVYAPNFTDAEFLQAAMIAQASQLDPSKREVYFIKYNNERPQVVTGYMTYLKVADQTGLLDGWEYREVEKNGKVVSGVITIYRKDMSHPIVHEVHMDEWNTNRAMWKSAERFMLKKMAIGQGFRFAFPGRMGSLPYLPEEVTQMSQIHIEQGQIEVSEPRSASPRRRTRKVDAPPAQNEPVEDNSEIEYPEDDIQPFPAGDSEELKEAFESEREKRALAAKGRKRAEKAKAAAEAPQENAPQEKVAQKPEPEPEPEPTKPDEVLPPEPDHLHEGEEPIPQNEQESIAYKMEDAFKLTVKDLETVLGTPKGKWTEPMKLFLRKGWVDIQNHGTTIDEFKLRRFNNATVPSF